MASEKDIAVKKHAIKKGSSHTTSQEDGIELPIGTILKVGAVLALFVLLVFGINYVRLNKTQPRVAAVVNGEQILWEEVESRYAQLPAQIQEYISEEVILNQSISEVLLNQKAKELGITVSSDEMDALMQSVVAQFTEEGLNSSLEMQGISYDEFRYQLGERVKINKVISQVIPEININDSALIEYFEENKDMLGKPEQVRLSRIVVNSSELAEQLLSRIKNGSDFGVLAEEYSIDTVSSILGGDLGFFSKGTGELAEFEDTAFSLGIGEVSEVINTTYGFHIIKVTDISAAEEADFEEIKPLLKFNLIDLKIREYQDKFDEYLQQLRIAADIQIIT
ncbi:MAG: peptidylprolyl isomerase [Candidatus Woesearchaeota archaeon]